MRKPFANRRLSPIFLAIGLLAAAQARTEQQAPQVRTTTRLVQFGVIVSDKNGPVRNLTKDDFKILDRGKRQPIDVFSAEAPVSSTGPAQPLPAGTYSNQAQFDRGQPRSTTIVLLDNLNTLFGANPEPYEDTPMWLEDHALAVAKMRLMDFLRQMDPRDHMAIYGLTDKLHVLCDFTCDREQLLAVVGKYNTHSLTPRSAAAPEATHLPEMADAGSGVAANTAITSSGEELAALTNGNRAELTFAALTAITDHVAGIPGRKNLLWLTANLPFSGKAVAAVLGRADIAAYPIDARGLLPRGPGISMDDVDEDALATGKIASLINNAPIPPGIETMAEMAADTGGRAFVNTNDLTNAIRSVVEDAGITYTIGFYLPAAKADGKFHKLTVQVRSAGLNVNYPHGYFAYLDAEATESESHNSFLTAVRSPIDAAALPLEVRINRPGQPSANTVNVLGAVGLKDLQLSEEGDVRKGTLDVYAIEQDAAGNVLHQTNQRLNIRLTGEQYNSYLRSGILFRQLLEPRPDTTILRIVVQAHNSLQVGSVIIPMRHLDK